MKLALALLAPALLSGCAFQAFELARDALARCPQVRRIDVIGRRFYEAGATHIDCSIPADIPPPAPRYGPPP